MTERPKTLDVDNDLYEKLSDAAGKLAPRAAAGLKIDDRTRDVVAGSVAQLFALTPRSFAAKFDEVCDCLADRGLVGAADADLFRRLGQGYARRDERAVVEALDAIERSPGAWSFIEKALEGADEDEPETQARKGGKRGGKSLWKWVGGIIGAVVGGVLGGWSGASLGFKVGWELGGLLYDLTSGGGGSRSNVMARPNGDPCTPPFFH